MKILTIIGARPQIIKAAAISRAIQFNFQDSISEVILHTGQHYDDNMSQVFFDELGIPVPNYNLQIGSGKHGEQTAKMIKGIEDVILLEKPDVLIVYGDTNSTLAGAIAASKLHIPIAHIEAGLRSFNMSMPEELNRVLCDHASTYLFPPTTTAYNNLVSEGFLTNRFHFGHGIERKVLSCGDVMYDNSLYFAKISQSRCLEELNIVDNNYILATVHRDSNTDNPIKLNAIFEALHTLSNDYDVVLPLHPRTRKMMQANLSSEQLSKCTNNSKLRMIPPASFLNMICLEKHAKLIVTDSGGVQKEAYFFKNPCVILRPETEWVEIVEEEAGVITDAIYDKIIEGYQRMLTCNSKFPSLYGNGDAGFKILDELLKR